MSEEQQPLPPVPEHTPPLKVDELRPDPGKYFNQAWTRWFTSLRSKVNVINSVVAELSSLVGNGIVVISGGTATTVSTTDLIAGDNVSFDVSGTDRILDNGSGPVTISVPNATNRSVVNTVNSTAGTTTIDCALGDYFNLPLSENTMIAFSNIPASPSGVSLYLKFTQDTSARTVSWPGSVTWPGGTPPTISPGSGDVDIVILTTVNQGTSWEANFGQAYS